MVAMAGLPLEVTLVKGLKSRPSLAMANRTRGIGNIDPSRLESQMQISQSTNIQTLSVKGQHDFAQTGYFKQHLICGKKK